MIKTLNNFIFGSKLNSAMMLNSEIIDKCLVNSSNIIPTIEYNGLMFRPFFVLLSEHEYMSIDIKFIKYEFIPSVGDFIIFFSDASTFIFILQHMIYKDININRVNNSRFSFHCYNNDMFINNVHILNYNSYTDSFKLKNIKINFDLNQFNYDLLLRRGMEVALSNYNFSCIFKNRMLIFGFNNPMHNYIFLSAINNFNNFNFMNIINKESSTMDSCYYVMNACPYPIENFCKFDNRIVFFKGKNIYSFFLDDKDPVLIKETCEYISSNIINTDIINGHLFFVTNDFKNIIYSDISNSSQQKLSFTNLMSFVYNSFIQVEIKSIHPFIKPFLGVLVFIDKNTFYICRISNNICSWYEQKTVINIDLITGDYYGNFFIVDKNEHKLFNLNLNNKYSSNAYEKYTASITLPNMLNIYKIFMPSKINISIISGATLFLALKTSKITTNFSEVLINKKLNLTQYEALVGQMIFNINDLIIDLNIISTHRSDFFLPEIFKIDYITPTRIGDINDK
jgi:hypothetical protein